MTLATGLRLPDTPPVLHFARSLTTWEWLISRVKGEPAPARTAPDRAQPSARP